MPTLKNPPSILFLGALLVLPILSAVSSGQATLFIDDMGFIRASCNHTPHPQACYFALAGAKYPTQEDPTCLARAAIHSTLQDAEKLASRLTDISRENPYDDPGPENPLGGCLDDIRAATSQIRSLLQKMRLQEGGQGQQRPDVLASAVKGAQTGLTAAIAAQRKCAHRFTKEAGYEHVLGHLDAEILEGAVSVDVLTSNSLALVKQIKA